MFSTNISKCLDLFDSHYGLWFLISGLEKFKAHIEKIMHITQKIKEHFFRHAYHRHTMIANRNTFIPVVTYIWILLPKLSFFKPDSIEAKKTTLIFGERLTQIF